MEGLFFGVFRLFGFGIGPTEMVVVGLVTLLLFAGRIPLLLRNIGRGISEFRTGLRSSEEVTP